MRRQVAEAFKTEGCADRVAIEETDRYPIQFSKI